MQLIRFVFYAALFLGLALMGRSLWYHLRPATVDHAPVYQMASVDHADPIEPRDLGLRVVMSGHSLTDPVPVPLDAMVRAAGGVPSVALSTIPGSPLEWRWNNAPELDLRARMAEFDTVVLTERVALSNTVPFHHTHDVALDFAQLAWAEGAGGRGAEVLIYATWVSLDSGPEFARVRSSDSDIGIPWRERLDREREGWESIRSMLDDQRPAEAAQVRIVPVIDVMRAIYDGIEDGSAPLDTITVLFRDDIHTSELGSWVSALTHYGVLYGRDPRGLTRPDGVSEDVAVWLENVVWEVVSNHPFTGLQR